MMAGVDSSKTGGPKRVSPFPLQAAFETLMNPTDTNYLGIDAPPIPVRAPPCAAAPRPPWHPYFKYYSTN